LRELHRQLREDEVDKRYLALVAGRWPRGRRVVDAPLEKNVLKSGERMVRVSASGKRAVTEFSVLERFDRATLLEARPVTGRTHQIRVHALVAGCPLLGDAKYASEASRALTREVQLKRLFLHATRLRLTLPGTGPLELEAALDHQLEAILDKLRN
jgi:23S rRNA pseudouridine955/2504/2580 synthase